MTDFRPRRRRRPQRPPPNIAPPWFELVREKLFGDATSSLITLAVAALVVFAAPPLWRFLIADAVWRAPDGALCRAPGAGACWAYIAAKTPFFIYGSYPPDQRWRVDVAFALAAVADRLAAVAARAAQGHRGVRLLRRAALRRLRAAAAARRPWACRAWGPACGAAPWCRCWWRSSGIVVALPGGVLLALGRRSELPALRMVCAGLIEFVRGVPLIAVLFMANAMLPLFLPPDWAPDRLLRPMFGIALFASAYMAEVVRAGLNSVPRGQGEAAQALGLGRVATLRFVVLPQALAAVIPAIVNNFVALFKDTTLVAIVGIFDFLHTVDTARLDPKWAGPTIADDGLCLRRPVLSRLLPRHVVLCARRRAPSRGGPSSK